MPLMAFVGELPVLKNYCIGAFCADVSPPYPTWRQTTNVGGHSWPKNLKAPAQLYSFRPTAE